MKKHRTHAKLAPRIKGKAVPHAAHKKAVGAKKKGFGAKPGRALFSLPPGYEVREASGIAVQRSVEGPVPAGKIRQGLTEANRAVRAAVDELVGALGGPYEIKEVKLIASFNAEGKFLGFGVGGAASIEVTICPCDDE